MEEWRQRIGNIHWMLDVALPHMEATRSCQICGNGEVCLECYENRRCEMQIKKNIENQMMQEESVLGAGGCSSVALQHSSSQSERKGGDSELKGQKMEWSKWYEECPWPPVEGLLSPQYLLESTTLGVYANGRVCTDRPDEHVQEQEVIWASCGKFVSSPVVKGEVEATSGSGAGMQEKLRGKVVPRPPLLSGGPHVTDTNSVEDTEEKRQGAGKGQEVEGDGHHQAWDSPRDLSSTSSSVAAEQSPETTSAPVRRNLRSRMVPKRRQDVAAQSSRRKKIFSCPFCNFTSKTKGRMTEHTRSFHQRTMRCSICDYKCGSRRMVNIHEENVHQGVKKHQCPQCTFRSDDEVSLKKHVGTVHYYSWKYRCPHCEYLSTNSHHLKHHIEVCQRGSRRGNSKKAS